MILELTGGQDDPFPVEQQNPGLWRTSAGGPERFNDDVQRPGGFLGDNDDSTYVYQTGPGLVGPFRLFFSDEKMPVNAQARSVRFLVRARSDTAGATLLCTMGTIGTIIPHKDRFPLTFTLQEYQGIPRTDPNSGRPWGQVEIDLILAIVSVEEFEAEGISPETYITKISCLVDVNLAPTITITGPAAAVTTTSRPVVTWTYSDAEGDAQERFRVRVFNAAQFNSPTFDPKVSKAFWDSGLEFSSAVSAQTGRLPNDTYRAYVVVGDVGSSGRLTFYDQYREWTQSFPAPGIPVITATGEQVPNRVRLELTETAGGTTTTSFVVQRSVAGGPYEDVLEVANTTAAPDVAYDYTAPRDAPLSYRAYARHSTPDEISESEPGQAVTTSLPSDGQFWLKSTTDPSLNTPICVSTDRLEGTSPETQGVFRAWGRPSPIVMSSGIHALIFDEIPFTFKNDAEFKAVATLRDRKETLLLQTTYGDGPLEQFFIRFGEDRSLTRITTPLVSQIRRISIGAYEVESV